jgi:hypothetical protein
MLPNQIFQRAAKVCQILVVARSRQILKLRIIFSNEANEQQ